MSEGKRLIGTSGSKDPLGERMTQEAMLEEIAKISPGSEATIRFSIDDAKPEHVEKFNELIRSGEI